MLTSTTGNSSAVSKVSSFAKASADKTRAQQFPASAVPAQAKRILEAYAGVESAKQTAVDRALICGQLLLEQREAIDGAQSFDRNKSDKSKFDFWMEKYCQEIPRRTAYRYMELAVKVVAYSGLVLDVDAKVSPLSMALTAPASELGKKELEWRQMLFEFTKGKTMKECLAGVVVEGDEAHRITRAHNGRNAKGAGGGGNRKNFVGFTATKLRHITTFLGNKLSPAEETKIGASFCASIKKWPRWLVQVIAEEARAEVKLSDEERAGRKLK